MLDRLLVAHTFSVTILQADILLNVLLGLIIAMHEVTDSWLGLDLNNERTDSLHQYVNMSLSVYNHEQ